MCAVITMKCMNKLRPVVSICMKNSSTFKGITFIGLEGCIKYSKGDNPVHATGNAQQSSQACASITLSSLAQRLLELIFLSHIRQPAGSMILKTIIPIVALMLSSNLWIGIVPVICLHGHVHTWDRRKADRNTIQRYHCSQY